MTTSGRVRMVKAMAMNEPTVTEPTEPVTSQSMERLKLPASSPLMFTVPRVFKRVFSGLPVRRSAASMSPGTAGFCAVLAMPVTFSVPSV